MAENQTVYLEKDMPSGFTLAEVLIAIVLISVGCLSVLWMHSMAMHGSNQAESVTVASFLAESELERIKSLPFEDATKEVVDNTGSPQVQELNRFGTEFVHPNPSGSVVGDTLPVFTRTVSYFPWRPTNFSHHIEIVVGWKDANGPHSISYSAVITGKSFTSK